MAADRLIFALWGVPDPRDPAWVDELTGAGAREVILDVADDAVAAAMLRLTTFETPVEAVLSLVAEPDTAAAVSAVLAGRAERVAGWRVETTAPLPPPTTPVGVRAPGVTNVAFLRRPAELAYDEWLARWRGAHTEVAIATQATFGYVQHRVLERVTADAPEIAAVVEELFPIEALHDPHAFYGSGGDPAELGRRIEAMMASVATFGADRDLDVVPTSRYRLC
ncbi:hypothetical protein [Nocardia farcinica]|uniref:EthD domain-containing protein n=1 Tax=Nocardia farcinica TaxID=37329 RepID=A0A0H5NHM8_NOCFR|nr:hypothetical protein [Nocardia farcinica]AXK84581.1 hypothetical protein DXT66_02005 [Nocardia farcinica]MBA4854216.1 hypothetical protein [Nocardia farcinica]MBC9814401.1 hypothetical protein [Nocardia farcinica]CRY74998.1 Uncharacterised protein [Nocardia farcinica]SIS63476.1 hypothetical protein SAMN05421776_101360 [Nocardia farcinica]